MKQIFNWRKATVSDLEGNGLLDSITKLHVVSCQLDSGKKIDIKGDDKEGIVKFLEYHIDNEIPIVGHNFITYDVPALEKILEMDLSRLMVIDTLALSWYLNIERKQHGLDTFFEDYGIAKPKIDEDDWDFQSDCQQELADHYERMRNRCSVDVDINTALWEDLKDRLIDMYTKAKEAIDSGRACNKKISKDERMKIEEFKGMSVEQHIDRFLSFLMFKMDTQALRQKTRIKLDLILLEETDEELLGRIEEAKKELEGVMPKVPKYASKNKPKKPYLKNGELSASGKSWNEALEGLRIEDELGHKLTLRVEDKPDTLKVLKKYEEPNINSSSQIKDWLLKNGWEPETFKFVKDDEAQERWVQSGFRKDLKPKPRQIPQITKDGEEGKELCPSVEKVAERVPEIMAYSKYTLIKHRYDFAQGFKRAMSEDGYVVAEVGGFTNTLREQHRTPVCNLPGVDKPYGKNLRGLLTCDDDQTMLGSDLSSLEDRVKNHFCLAHDPEYVKTTQIDGYDPHVYMCLQADMVSQEDWYDWLKGNKRPNVKAVRPMGKEVNYSSIYGAGPETISRNSGMPLEQAKKLHKTYWEIHAYVKSIAKEQEIIQCSLDHNWLVNPINGFLYSVRTEKDIFSTLVQGTGSFLFDMWVDNVLTEMYDRWGVAMLTLLYHDELAFPFKDTPKMRDIMDELVQGAIQKVNEDWKMRIDLGCVVQYGKSYADIH